MIISFVLGAWRVRPVPITRMRSITMRTTWGARRLVWLAGLLAGWLAGSARAADDAPAGGLPPELGLVPPDAGAFVSVRPSAILETVFGKDGQALLARALPADLKKLQEMAG